MNHLVELIFHYEATRRNFFSHLIATPLSWTSHTISLVIEFFSFEVTDSLSLSKIKSCLADHVAFLLLQEGIQVLPGGKPNCLFKA